MTRLNTTELGEAFIEGAESGHISTKNLYIQLHEPGVTLLKSYGATIAARDANTNSLVVFDGWRGYSPTTSTHMGKTIGKRHDPDDRPYKDWCQSNGWAYVEVPRQPGSRGDLTTPEALDRLEIGGGA